MKQTLPQKSQSSQDNTRNNPPNKTSSINIVEQSYPDVIRYLKKQSLKPNPKVVDALLKLLQ